VEHYRKCLQAGGGDKADLVCMLSAARALQMRVGGGNGNAAKNAANQALSEWAARAAALLVKEVGDSTRQAFAEKSVVFVMDNSGSMAGGQMNAACRNMLMVFDDYVGDADQCAFINFTSRSQVIFEMGEVGGARARMRQQMGDACKIVGGATAFRDALHDGLQQLHQHKQAGGGGGGGRGGDPEYVIALTDGEDNRSRFSESDIRGMFQQHAHANVSLIVIGLGIDPSYSAGIQSMCNTSNKGVYIDAADTAQLGTAFKKVARLISGPSVLIEDI